jgi:hypothetical protein
VGATPKLVVRQIIAGQDIADAISKVPVSSEKSLVPVLVKTVTIQRKQ